jgi:type VI secretion system protein ImpE
MVWAPGYLTFDNGGEVVAMIPSRYPGSEASTDPQIRLSRKTEWTAIGAERYAGLGQRLFSSSLGDHDLLSVRLLELQPPPSADGEAEAGVADDTPGAA